MSSPAAFSSGNWLCGADIVQVQRQEQDSIQKLQQWRGIVYYLGRDNKYHRGQKIIVVEEA